MILSHYDRDGRILEVGCGIGNFIIPALQQKCDIYGIDVGIETVTYVRGALGENRVTVSQAEKLPFPDKSFHLIVARGVIHHLESPEHGLSEMYRVLHPNGKIIIFEGAPEGLYRRFSLGLADMFGIQHEKTNFEHLSYAHIGKLLPVGAKLNRIWVGGLFAPLSYVGVGQKGLWNILEKIRIILQRTVPWLFGWWNLIIVRKEDAANSPLNQQEVRL